MDEKGHCDASIREFLGRCESPVWPVVPVALGGAPARRSTTGDGRCLLQSAAMSDRREPYRRLADRAALQGPRHAFTVALLPPSAGSTGQRPLVPTLQALSGQASQVPWLHRCFFWGRRPTLHEPRQERCRHRRPPRTVPGLRDEFWRRLCESAQPGGTGPVAPAASRSGKGRHLPRNTRVYLPWNHLVSED